MSAPTTPLKLPKLDFETAAHAKKSILYKGESGYRKTTYALTWPQPLVGLYTETNQATVVKAIKAGVNVVFYNPANWAEVTAFSQAAKNRQIDAKSLILDTLDGVGAVCFREIAGPSGEMDQQKWGRFLSRMRFFCEDVAQAAKPKDGKPAYHIVCTSHLKDITDDKGNLVKIRCKIDGQFKDDVEAFFDTVLLCDMRLRAEQVEEAGRRFMRQTPEFFCRALPPDKYHTCKPNGLPAEVGGTYPELVAAWGEKE